MHALANPARFLRLMAAIRPYAAAVAIIGLVVGLGWGLLISPRDYQQGETVRIMYIHVPSAWMAMFIYAAIAVSSAVALIWRHPVAELVAKASAPVGAAFTLICLVTGSLWGKPMWGTWWVWDARLTSMLILFFLYLGYIALWEAFDDPSRAGRAAAILALVGAVNLPIIKFSVDWWNTLHQPASVLTLEGPKIHPDILWPLLITAVGAQGYYVWILSLRVRAEILNRQARILRFSAAADRRAG
ncbi:heme ABC transporter permease [uncultured Ferrovibrio sp.]|jgi:heme exporter protein C|uniref:heme ABC transporter permease n=1 Tax=uncultured Ferrovibrio sp. TaxID=1576913 RepID=UPI002637E02A|nr:heme ABC transporter permease [uncultured Ferrovibrio sp.]